MLKRVREASFNDNIKFTNEYNTYKLEDDDNETIQYMLKMKKSEDLTYKYDPFFDTRPEFITINESKMYAIHILSLKIIRENRVSNVTLKVNMEKYARSGWYRGYMVNAGEGHYLFNEYNLSYFILTLFNRLCYITNYDYKKDKKIKGKKYSYIVSATVNILPIAYNYNGKQYIVNKGDKIKDIKPKDELTYLEPYEYMIIACEENDDATAIYKNYFKLRMLNVEKLILIFRNINETKGINLNGIVLDLHKERIGYGSLVIPTENFGKFYYNYDYDIGPMANLFLYSKEGNNIDIIINDENLLKKIFPNEDQQQKINRLTMLCDYYAVRSFKRMKRKDFDYLESTHVLDKNLHPPFKPLLKKIRKHDTTLISILAVVSLDDGRNAVSSLLVNIHHHLLELITDNYRHMENKLYELIVDWYENSKDWDILAQRVGFYSPFKTINGNYKAINLLIYSIGQYYPFINRGNDFNVNSHINKINIEDWKYQISFLSDFEIIEFFDNKYRKMLDQSFFNVDNIDISVSIGRKFIYNTFKKFIKDKNIWSIYRKKKCLNDKVMNIMMGDIHLNDDKEGNLLSYGYFKYDCYVMEDLLANWQYEGVLEKRGFVNPDYIDPEIAKSKGFEIGNNDKQIFSLGDIKKLIKYLKNDINEEDKPKYAEFVKFLEDNLFYADTDRLDIIKNSKLVESIDQDALLYFFSMILCLVMKARYWGIVDKDIPYLKSNYDRDEMDLTIIRDNKTKYELRSDNTRNFFENVFYPWLMERDLNTLNILIRLINIQPTYLNKKEYSRYKPDRRNDRSKIPKNVSEMKKFLDSLAENGSKEECKLVEYNGSEETYYVKKNTLFGRIIHGVFHEGACFGVNGDLFIDNLKIYNKLYLKYNKDDYNVILTENVKKILLGEFGKNVIIDLNKFEYTHPQSYNQLFMRKPGLEEYY